MSSTEVAEAVTKLNNLSQERAQKVLSLIEDLSELEALEDAADLKDAREVLAEVKAASPASSTDTKATTPSDTKAEFSNASDDNAPADTRPTIPYDEMRRELGLDR